MTLIIFPKVKFQLNYKSSINNGDENERFVKRLLFKIWWRQFANSKTFKVIEWCDMWNCNRILFSRLFTVWSAFLSLPIYFNTTKLKQYLFPSLDVEKNIVFWKSNLILLLQIFGNGILHKIDKGVQKFSSTNLRNENRFQIISWNL